MEDEIRSMQDTSAQDLIDRTRDEAVEKVWHDLWQRIVMPKGTLDLEQVKRELFDFHRLMDNAAKVYMHVTGGRISKTNTCAASIIAVADDVVSETVVLDRRQDW